MSTLPARAALPAAARVRDLAQRVDLILVGVVLALCALSIYVVQRPPATTSPPTRSTSSSARSSSSSSDWGSWWWQ